MDLKEPIFLNELEENLGLRYKASQSKYGFYLSVIEKPTYEDVEFILVKHVADFWPSTPFKERHKLKSWKEFDNFIKDNKDRIKLGVFHQNGKEYHRFFEVKKKTEFKNIKL